MLIKTKAEYYRLAELGLAGNCPRTWHDPETFLRESDIEFASVRILTVASNKFRAVIPRNEVSTHIRNMKLKTGEYVINEIPLAGEILIQGELGWHGDWVLYYSHLQTPMRQALKTDGQHIPGHLNVWNTLNQYCTPADIADLKELFDLYTCSFQYPVIELAAINRNIGIFPHRNTLVWEIRHY